MNKLLLLLFPVMLFFSCRKETTRWYSDWVLPVANDTLDLVKLTNDSTLAIENGVYVLDLHRTIASISPSEYIQLPDTVIGQKFAIGISVLTVPAGSSFLTSNEDLVFDMDEVELKKARVKSGSIFLEVFSPIETITFFEIELPSVTLDGQVIKKTLEVPAGTPANLASNSMEVDLSGYVIDLTGSSGTDYNSLPSKLKVTSDPEGEQVTITSADSTHFKIRMQDIRLDYGRGYFGHHLVNDSYTFDSKFLKNQLEGVLDLSAMSLQLDFENGIKTSGKVKLEQLKNTNTGTGSEVSLSHPVINNAFVLESATGSWGTLEPYEKSLVFDGGNSNLEGFIENLGDQTLIDYELELNPWGNTSGGWDEFFPNSSFDVRLHVQMPLNLSMDQLVLSDTFALDLDQQGSAVQLHSGNLVLKLENAFPFQGELELQFYDSANQQVYVIEGLDKIPSSTFGTLTSLNIFSSKSQLVVPFPEELLLRSGEIKKIRVLLRLNTPNPVSGNTEMVSIPEKAFFKIVMQASFKLENRIGE